MKFWFELIQNLPQTSTDKLVNQEVETDINFTTTEQNLVAQVNQPISIQNLPESGTLTGISIIIAFSVFLILSVIFAVKKLYVIAPTNEALVRTGGFFSKDARVTLHGGTIVIPGLNELTRVPLREISIDVERTDKLAVRTQDYLRANMRVTFYVCISKNESDIKTAASRLSNKGRISADDIKEALEKRADDAIRAAAKKKSIAEIDSDKLGFADEVLNLIQSDLKKVGLTLNNIAISEIEESDTYDENNFFDAQGVKLRTETIQRSIKQKREVELTTQVEIQQQELAAEKRSLQLVKEKEDAKLTQAKEVESLKLAQQQELEALRSQQEREIQETKDKEAAKIERNKILQTKVVEEEKIEQQLAVQQSKIEADIALEERNKQLKVTQTLQKQEAEVAEIERQKIIEASQLKAKVEVAQAERESQIAQQDTAIAIANKERDRYEAEAEKAQAEAAVTTAMEVEKAERDQRLALITAQQEADNKRISDQNVIEIDVFRRKRQAEIARQAAELEAESIRTLAEAKRFEALAEAEGKKALIDAENALSDANRTAELLKAIWPELAEKLPEILQALAPQPGVLGDARIYSFPGANGSNGNGASSAGDINKLLLSTSGLALINSLLEEGKLGQVLGQVKDLLNSDGTSLPVQDQPVEEEHINPPTEIVRSISPDS